MKLSIQERAVLAAGYFGRFGDAKVACTCDGVDAVVLRLVVGVRLGFVDLNQRGFKTTDIGKEALHLTATVT